MHLRCLLHPLEAERRSPTSCSLQNDALGGDEAQYRYFPSREDESSREARCLFHHSSSKKRDQKHACGGETGQTIAHFYPAPSEERARILKDGGSSDGKFPPSLTHSHLGNGKHKPEGSQSPSLPLSSIRVKKQEDAQISHSTISVCQGVHAQTPLSFRCVCTVGKERERSPDPFSDGSV